MNLREPKLMPDHLQPNFKGRAFESEPGLVPPRLFSVFQVKRNLQTNGFEVDNDLIRETWHPVYRRSFLTKALSRCQDCRRGFYIYNQGIESDVSPFNESLEL